jgi:UDP-N-acetylglucosamine 2-epimerase
MIIEMEKILVNEAPTRVIVQGDTNTVWLAAFQRLN